MHIVQFTDDDRLGRALKILFYEVQGTFQMQPEGRLLVGDRQYQALTDAGLLDANGQPGKNQKADGAKEKY